MLIIYYKKRNIKMYRERYISISRIYSGKRECVLGRRSSHHEIIHCYTSR